MLFLTSGENLKDTAAKVPKTFAVAIPCLGGGAVAIATGFQVNGQAIGPGLLVTGAIAFAGACVQMLKRRSAEKRQREEDEARRLEEEAKRADQEKDKARKRALTKRRKRAKARKAAKAVPLY